jgi:hypothetical protein
MQSMKALRADQLHSHLIKEGPKMLEELYAEFRILAEQRCYIFAN